MCVASFRPLHDEGEGSYGFRRSIFFSFSSVNSVVINRKREREKKKKYRYILTDFITCPFLPAFSNYILFVAKTSTIDREKERRILHASLVSCSCRLVTCQFFSSLFDRIKCLILSFLSAAMIAYKKDVEVTLIHQFEFVVDDSFCCPSFPPTPSSACLRSDSPLPIERKGCSFANSSFLFLLSSPFFFYLDQISFLSVI